MIGTIYDGKGLGKRPATKHLSRLQAYCLTVMVYKVKSRDCSKHCHSESTLETETLVVGPHERLSLIFVSTTGPSLLFYSFQLLSNNSTNK